MTETTNTPVTLNYARPGTAASPTVDVSSVRQFVTALLLALAEQAFKRFGTLDPEELRPMRG